MRLALLGGLLAHLPNWAWAQGTANPSFPCDRAKALDEIAICSDARLAELDRLRAADSQKAKRSDSREAIRTARSILEARSNCGNDRVCILDAMTFAGYPDGSPTPDWVESYREQLIRDVLKDDLSANPTHRLDDKAHFL